MRLIVLIFVFFCTEVLATNNTDLLSVIVIYRHGDRSPKKFAPLDPYKDDKNWPAGRGELTNRGIQQHYNLGKWLRQQYGDFLPSTYHKDDIYVRSANVDRCLMSGAANLAGLYPPVGDQIWNPNLLWRPIPIHTLPKKKDSLLQSSKACPRYSEVYQEVLKSKQFKEIDAMNSKLYEYLSSNLGVPIKTFTDIHTWYDTLKVEDIHNLTLPNWTKSVYPEPMKNWTELAYQVKTYTPELARFETGPIFDTISSHFLAVTTNNTKELMAKKMVMFSGHQTNLCDITNSLEVFRSSPYASALIFELRNDTKSSKQFVKLLYKTEEQLEVLNMKNCSAECDLKDFLKIVQPLRLNEDEYKKECKVNKD